MGTSSLRGEEHEITLPAGRLRYRVKGHGRPVVFLHGYYVNGDLWKNVVASMPGDVTCITPDLPLTSHAVPMKDDADLSMPGIARIVSDLLDALDLEDVVLVGNDSGGAIAQIVVTEHPERIGGLVLTPTDAFEQAPPFPFTVIPVLARIPGVATATNLAFRSKLVRRAVFRPFMKHSFDDKQVRSWVEPAQRDRRIARDGVKFARSASPRYTLAAAEKLAHFEHPTLLLWPPDCTFFKFELAGRLAAAIPDARIVPVEDAWSFLPLDQPDSVADEIAAFVGSDSKVVAQPGVTR